MRALATYLTCLETSGKSDTGCPLATADADAIESDYTAATCNTDSKFTATCICQKDFWKTDQTANADKCSAAKAYIVCLKGKTAVACDTSSTVAALATGVENRITDLGTTDCPVSTACQCEINAAKADISSDDKACTAYKAQYACVYPLDTAPCVSGTTIAQLKIAAAESVTSTTSCNFDDTCLCQREFDDATKTTDAEKCTAHKTELSCLRTAQSAGCDGTTTKSAIATTSENARAALPTSACPALSATCECEVDAAKGDASTSEKFCTVLTTLKTCLSAISTTTEEGCATMAQAALVTDTDTKIAGAKCGNFADHVTFAMTSLVVPVLVHLFL
ncbi:uncharacterized protein [Haliotis asinina]|uniref:uncharacterized protein n=1 Tax=Haliotis asinina TaxID=109174 RepID=UPI0035319900